MYDSSLRTSCATICESAAAPSLTRQNMLMKQQWRDNATNGKSYSAASCHKVAYAVRFLVRFLPNIFRPMWPRSNTFIPMSLLSSSGFFQLPIAVALWTCCHISLISRLGITFQREFLNLWPRPSLTPTRRRSYEASSITISHTLSWLFWIPLSQAVPCAVRGSQNDASY